ncbi:hypothetical protein CYMTET_17371 [Cymbomonas tetramitiformis]|uniref:Uncharacterized protein n=1 Tax=Cymbomonas tetramitiformis TaxID=36881 RepID=A0AAE0GAT2_9CHLO|nr:hypothetical protein CYMTET_17371 [Cymbomonas tetramitiformis]
MSEEKVLQCIRFHGSFSRLSENESNQGAATFFGALTAELVTPEAQKCFEPSAKPHGEATEDFQIKPANEQANVVGAPAPRTPLPWRSSKHAPTLTTQSSGFITLVTSLIGRTRHTYKQTSKLF